MLDMSFPNVMSQKLFLILFLQSRHSLTWPLTIMKSSFLSTAKTLQFSGPPEKLSIKNIIFYHFSLISTPYQSIVLMNSNSTAAMWSPLTINNNKGNDFMLFSVWCYPIHIEQKLHIWKHDYEGSISSLRTRRCVTTETE